MATITATRKLSIVDILVRGLAEGEVVRLHDNLPSKTAHTFNYNTQATQDQHNTTAHTFNDTQATQHNTTAHTFNYTQATQDQHNTTTSHIPVVAGGPHVASVPEQQNNYHVKSHAQLSEALTPTEEEARSPWGRFRNRDYFVEMHCR